MSIQRHKPHLILVVLDTTRARNLSCYGHERQTTPFLDEFARKAIVYQMANSTSPWTLPSHASLFTGMYPTQHRVRRPHTLSDVQAPVLAERLRQQGYQTAGFSSNSWISGEFGFDRGFDTFLCSWQLAAGEADFFQIRQRMREMDRLDAARLLVQSTVQGTPLRNLVNGLYGLRAFSYDKGARLINWHVRRWFQRNCEPDRPFFMFINYMEPHLPYRPPRGYRQLFMPPDLSPDRSLSINQDPFAYVVGAETMQESEFQILESLYDAELHYLDSRFGQLLQVLDEQGVLDKALLIITSDHGENIGDHGLMDHQYCLYDTLLHVPLLIRAPAGTYAPQVVDQRVETKDIFYTALDFLELEEESCSTELANRSLLPDRLGQHHRRHCFAEYLAPQPTLPELRAKYPGFDCPQYDRRLRAIYSDDGYKFIWASDGEHELYDLGDDPSETENLLPSEPKKAQELETVLEMTLPDLAEQVADAEEREISPAVRKRLEGLGYL